jgi:hypothetical protein
MKKNIFRILIICLGILPSFAFATGTDNTFSEIANTLQQYISGSLGTVILMVCLVGVIIALTGFAPMKVMFPVLVVAIIIRFGPQIVINMAGTGAEIHSQSRLQAVMGNGLQLALMLLLVGAVFSLTYKNSKLTKSLKEKEMHVC